MVADALRPVDPVGASAAEQATAEDGLPGPLPYVVLSPQAAIEVAEGRVDALHDEMRVLGPDGEERPLDKWENASKDIEGVEVVGTASRSTSWCCPHHGERLRGVGIRRRVEAGPSRASSEPRSPKVVEALAARGHTVAVLGAAPRSARCPR